MSTIREAVTCAVGACYEPWLLGALGDLFQKAKAALEAEDNVALTIVANEFTVRGNQILRKEDSRGVYSPKFYKKDVAFAMAILLEGYASGNDDKARGAAGFFTCAADYFITSSTEHAAIPAIAADWASRDTAPVWLEKIAAMLG